MLDASSILALHHRGTEAQRGSRQGIAIIEWATQMLRSSDYRRNHHQTGLALKVGFLRCRIGSGFEGVATELDNLEVCSTRSKSDDFASFAMVLAIFAFQNTPMRRPEPMSRRPRRHRRLHPSLCVSVPLWFNPAGKYRLRLCFSGCAAMDPVSSIGLKAKRGGCRLPVVEAWKELRAYRRFARTGTVTVGKSLSVVARVRVASREPGSASALTVTVTW